MNKIEIEYRAIGELCPNEKNSRKHSPQQIEQLMASIQKFGFTVPIAIDDKDVVICGHGRLAAAKKLGMDEVPTIKLGHLTEEQKRAYLIADNKIAENSNWDNDELRKEIKELETSFDFGELGFFPTEMDKLFPPIEEVLEKTTAEPENKEETLYDPSKAPPLEKLYNRDECEKLQAKIRKMPMSEGLREFLLMAAERTVKYDFFACWDYCETLNQNLKPLFKKCGLIEFETYVERQKKEAQQRMRIKKAARRKKIIEKRYGKQGGEGFWKIKESEID